MNLNFLDKGLPVESGNFKTASEDMRKFREYCKQLGKNASELTEDELDKFRNEAS
jgi:hypothetical protein